MSGLEIRGDVTRSGELAGSGGSPRGLCAHPQSESRAHYHLLVLSLPPEYSPNSAPNAPYPRGTRAARYPDAIVQPFQFPSLQHFLERMERACAHAIDVEGLSPKTVSGYRSATRQFVAYLRVAATETAFLGGQLTMQLRILEDWIAWLRQRGANHTTVNHYWRALHAQLARIARADGIVDPTVHVPTPRPGKPAPRFLTRAALEDVFAFARNYDWGSEFARSRNVALIAVMALGGLRLGEVLRLTMSDVNVTEERITVRRGKGRHGGKDRAVYMAPALRVAFGSYLAERRRRYAASPRVFLSTQADEGIGDVTVRRVFNVVRLKTGIKIAPHMLRHTCATLMRQAGIPDRLAMEELGHASLTVLQRYSHVENGELQQGMKRLTIDADLA